MKKSVERIVCITAVALMLPMLAGAQVLGDQVYSLNSVLDKLFKEMLPLCSRLVDVGRVIAGFAALWYIAIRVWRHLARAESIDFYPLLRPFAVGMAIMLFPQVISLMNGVLEPTVLATRAMSQDSHKAILYNITQQGQNVTQTPPTGVYPGGSDNTEKYEQPDGTTDKNGLSADLKAAFSFFSFKSIFKILISELTQMLYAAAELCINTIRTFYLIVLVILGPLALGLSVFDGFQQSLASWFARYINIYMWLPVANIFGAICSKILENMLTLDQGFASSTAYIIFMIISIVGYTTVPNVASYIIDAGGKDTLLHKVTNMSKEAGKAAVTAMI